MARKLKRRARRYSALSVQAFYIAVREGLFHGEVNARQRIEARIFRAMRNGNVHHTKA